MHQKILHNVGAYKTPNTQTNKCWSRIFKGAQKSKVNRSKRLTGQGEILARQDFDRNRRLTSKRVECM